MQQENFYTGGGIVAIISLGMYLCFICRSFKILEETTNRLVFQIRPTFFWAVSIFFGAIALMFILVTLSTPPTTILNCNYSSSPKSSVNQRYPSCQLVGISWLGTEQNKTSIVELQATIIDVDLNNINDNKLLDGYRVVLVTDRGNIPLANGYVYGIERAEYQHFLNVVSQINSFLAKPLQDSLIIEQDEKVLGYIGLAIDTFFALITFLILAIPSYITCSFDRESNLVTIERRNLFGKKTFDHKISDIAAVKVEEQSDIESTTYRLTLLLTSDEKLPLTYMFTSSWQEKEEIAERLQKFLGISNPTARRKARGAM